MTDLLVLNVRQWSLSGDGIWISENEYLVDVASANVLQWQTIVI